MTGEVPIERFEGIPVSDMARNRAVRSVQEALDIDDPLEKVTELIIRANNGISIAEGYKGELMDVFSPAFKHGIRVAIRTLAAAGLAAEVIPIEGLIRRALQVDLGSSLLMRQAYNGDPRNLYLPIDGGNGE